MAWGGGGGSRRYWGGKFWRGSTQFLEEKLDEGASGAWEGHEREKQRIREGTKNKGRKLKIHVQNKKKDR